MSSSRTNLDEVCFFLDGRAELAMRVVATGATTTEVMAAVSMHELDTPQGAPKTLAEARVLDVCMMLEEADAADAEEIALADIDAVA